MEHMPPPPGGSGGPGAPGIPGEVFRPEEIENLEDIIEIRYLEDSEMEFARNDGGILTLNLSGTFYPNVILQRAFPISRPSEYIAVKEAAEHRDMGKELGIIKNLADLSEKNRALVEEELEIRYFVPEITKIISLKDEYGSVYMTVATTAGEKKIVVPNQTSNFIRLTQDRFLILDVDGNRFEIPSLERLDRKSVRLLEVAI